MTRVLVIDNYDSFTWNLVHLLGPLATSVDVIRNDAITADEVLAAKPDAIVLSPGPCTPNEAGICLDLVKRTILKEHIKPFIVHTADERSYTPRF